MTVFGHLAVVVVVVEVVVIVVVGVGTDSFLFYFFPIAFVKSCKIRAPSLATRLNLLQWVQ